ncbi:glycosyltransferase family 2 protein [Neisseriaceae bacterium TC5R-5]|nr:glycosyltransferase family 2 protein [Neisseriaceae bacterium TC5R-5]
MRTYLSAVIITKNAENHLEKCLSSLQLVDEIVIVDSGSTDQTLLIANNYGARVIHQEWLGFGLQKQFAVKQAQYDWVLCLDSDEWLSDNLAIEIKQLMLNPQSYAYSFPRCNRFMGRFLKHGEGYPDRSLRLFNRCYAQWSDDQVHEYVMTKTTVDKLQSDLMHESGENIERYLAKQNHYTSLQAQTLFARGKLVGKTKLILSPLLRFIKFYFIRLGCLDGLPGLVHISIGCFNSYIKYAKLIEAHRLRKTVIKSTSKH